MDDDLTLSDHFINRLFQTIKEKSFFVVTGIENEAYNNSYYIFYLKKFFTEEFSMIEESYIRDLNIQNILIIIKYLVDALFIKKIFLIK